MSQNDLPFPKYKISYGDVKKKNVFVMWRILILGLEIRSLKQSWNHGINLRKFKNLLIFIKKLY